MLQTKLAMEGESRTVTEADVTRVLKLLQGPDGFVSMQQFGGLDAIMDLQKQEGLKALTYGELLLPVCLEASSICRRKLEPCACVSPRGRAIAICR
jgi:hypothetical protein